MTSSFVYQLTHYPIRTVKTTLMVLIMIGLGISVVAVGPALLDLQLLAGTTIEKAALLLPARSLGYAIGSVIGGIVGERYDHQKVLMLSMIIAIVTLCVFALFQSIVFMYCIIFICGCASGCIDTVLNIWLIFCWGKANPPFMQILHFAYGLGAFIAPFIVEPFLLNKDTDSDVVIVSETVTEFAHFDHNSTLPTTIGPVTNGTVLKGSASDVMIHWSFLIAALYYLFVLLVFGLIYVFHPENIIHPSRTETDTEDNPNAKKDPFKLNRPLSNWLKIFVVIVSTATMHVYCGLEISFGALLSPFAVKSKIHMTKSEGSFLTSAYWGMFTFLRAFSLIAIIFLSPRLLLLINFGIIMISNAILLPLGNSNRTALWLGTGLMGLGCSSIFATIFAFLEQLTPVTSRITAGFLVAACAGELVIPAVVASYLEETPQVFLWVIMTYSTAALVGVLVLILVQYLLLKYQRREEIEMQQRRENTLEVDKN